MEQQFKKELKSLEKIFEFLNHFMSANDIDASTAFSINVADEEFFTNMVKYDSDRSNDISISAVKETNRLVIRLTANDVERFDVTRAAAVNTNQSLAERKVGGLGIHMAKRLIDSISYDYRDRTSTITLIKNLEK